MPTTRFVICDVFSDRPLAGNQLAVFTRATGLSSETMQALAREMGFSESTFVMPPEQAGDARVRIFTPRIEVPFAGHPVLGTAFVLGLPLQKHQLNLETAKGIVPVRLEREGARVSFGWMQQPLPQVAAFEPSEELFAALGVEGSMLPVESYDNGIRHVYVVVESRDAVAALKPDMARLAALPALCFSVFAYDGGEVKTRMFAPGAGVDEDPATGSAAGPLAMHLARHEKLGFDQELRIEQGAELARPSVLFAKLAGSGDTIEHVEVGGSAVVVARGEFQLPGG